MIGGDDRGDLLHGINLIEQFRQHRRVTDIAGGDLDGANLQRFLVNSEVDLAPDTALGPSMLC